MSLGYLATSLMLSPAFRTNVSGRRLPSHKKNVYHPAFTKKEVQTYAKWGLAWTTNRVYELGEKRSFQFCLSDRLMSREGDILPASEITLIYVASYLARTIKHSSIKLYLAAVRNLHISCGHGDPLSGKLLLKKILRGIFTLPRPVTHSSSSRHSGVFTSHLANFCTPGWGITTLLWSGQPSSSPFLRFSAVTSLFIRGFRDFAPG